MRLSEVFVTEGGKNVTVTFDSANDVDDTGEALYNYLEKSTEFDPWTENVHPEKEIRDVYNQLDRSNLIYLWDEDEREIVKAAITLYNSKRPSLKMRQTLARVMAKLG